MTEQLQVLPLGFVMVMGPQILTAIFLVTSRKPALNSAAMLLGVALAASLSIAIWFGLAEVIGIDTDRGGNSGPTTADYVAAGVLVLLGIHVYLTRKTAEPPKWMKTLQEAEPKRAFTLGFLLILLMPTDIVAVLSTVSWLRQSGHDVLDGWPLVAVTLILMALPIAAYLLLGKRAKRAMPGVRDWLTENGWVVNLVVISYFTTQTLS
jgi:hypothetical protein